MATNVTPVSPASRADPRQVVNTLKKTVNFNTPGIAAGVLFDNSLPRGAFILSVLVEIVTVFNAGTTNVLTVGTTAGGTDIVNGADVNEAAVAVTPVTRALGRGLAAAAEKQVWVNYTQTGTPATTGQAVIVITYEGGISPS